MASKNGNGAAVLEAGTLVPALEVTNDASEMIEWSQPYRARVRLKGTAPIIFHRYSIEAVEEKGNAAKGSKTKKSDDIESYVYRTKEGYIGLDGLMFAAAIREAGRSEPDPRSPRKSMRDLLKSVVIPVEVTAPFLPETRDWDFLHRCRSVVQRAAITRVRPAMHSGWEILFNIDVTSSDYLPVALLRKLIRNAGMFQGLADYRPTYGRFDTIGFEIVTLDD